MYRSVIKSSGGHSTTSTFNFASVLKLSSLGPNVIVMPCPDKHFAKRENYHIHKKAISIITKLAELDLNEKIEITLKYDEEAFKNSQASNLEEWLTKRLLKKEPYQLVSEKEVV